MRARRRSVNGKPISVEKSVQLVSGAREIIDWVEKLLPETKRRAVLRHAPEVTLLKYVTRLAPNEGDVETGGSEAQPPAGE